jgi:hypothetical protein
MNNNNAKEAITVTAIIFFKYIFIIYYLLIFIKNIFQKFGD